MSMTLYLKNGGPAGTRPWPSSQPNTSPKRRANAAISPMVTLALTATYGCSARVSISGADDISSSSRCVDWLLQFGHPLPGIGAPVQRDLAGVARGAVSVGVDPPRQCLAGRQHVVHRAVVDDGRRAVHLGQVHDGDAVGRRGGHRHGGVHDDAALGLVLVVRDGRTGRRDVGAGQAAPHVVVERLDDRRDGLWFVARGYTRQFGYPDRREALDDDPFGRHPGSVLDRQQPRLDPGEPGRLGLDAGLDLRPAQPEHAAQFRRADLLREDRLHLLQGEAEVLERDDAVQLVELARLVEAVPGSRIDAGRPDQPDRVVVPEHPDRDAAVPCELPDAEHDVSGLQPHTVSEATGVTDRAAGSRMRLCSAVCFWWRRSWPA